ncbi:hypothetical protein G7Y89_g13354 [Cudoniella acicularis]|uniref:SUI1 domain-containing protein n=1 Tax=Cudoniella acicularis TaxID=354080 RepID=A0A8H4RAX0_9HELO|nr:hypothetical protein G7Y89_g13354 [Cudoniella acicularis]
MKLQTYFVPNTSTLPTVDMRRPDLIIPYQSPAAKENAGDISSTLGSTLPMAAMFTRNKFIGWASVVFAIQNWLGESAETRKTASQPAYFSVGMSLMALAVTYLPMFLPPPTVPGSDPFAEADEGTGETKQSQSYIHIRIQHKRADSILPTERNGRKTLTTVQGLPKKFDQWKILRVIKKKFACNGTVVVDDDMGEVIQLQGDQRNDVQKFLIDKKEGLELDPKTIKIHGF